MAFEEPEIVKQGSKFGVKLKASAPSLHFIKADVKDRNKSNNGF